MASVLLKIKRQDDPMDLPYWELFEVNADPGTTVVGALGAIQRRPVTSEGNPTAPVVWDCSCEEGLCGACTMLINGRARQSCGVMLDEFDGAIVLEPLSKFPVVRDLKVDRSAMLAAVGRHGCWIDVDELTPRGEPVRISRGEGEAATFLDCVLCGACSEACPQVNARSSFSGAFVFSHVLPLNRHSRGGEGAEARLSSLAGRGGVADCAGAENCERACPRGIPLVKASVVLSWDATLYSARRFFRG